MIMRCIVLTPCLLLLHMCIAQDDVVSKGTLTVTKNPCIQVTNPSCGSCLAAGIQCAFCADVDYDKKNKPRCDLKSTHESSACKDIISPGSELVLDKKKKVMDGTASTPAVQLSPQRINITLRPHDPQTFNLTFRLAENYPVDLYYLMDLSFSMQDDKEKLALLGTEIAINMKKITENFRLGFGSFVDKVVMPYVSTAPSNEQTDGSSKLKSPCTGCVPPYGFKNQLKLDENTTKFAENVRKANVSGNLDAPEGGFDAIMQSIACNKEIGWRSVSRKMLLFSTDADFHYAGDGKDEIGWRDQSRRMLLFSTDASFHFAGDGKLGGILKPNDGICHLDRSGTYTKSTVQDYPSISQIAAKTKEKNVNIIFAVTKDQFPTYKKLEDFIPGSGTGELANDSSNIVSLVQSNYDLITSKLELTTVNADGLSIKFKTACKGQEMKETNICQDLNIGDSVNVTVEIEATSCPTDRKKLRREVKIKPVALADTLVLDLNLICECDCEKPQFFNPNRNSPKCEGQGTFVCGTCLCNDGFYGKTCNCSSGNITSAEKQQQCIRPGFKIPCSDKGECVCGKCECYTRRPNSAQRYSGEFCECDDYSCPHSGGSLCGGVDRGDCECERCKCKEGWSGEACGCSTKNNSCIDSSGGICNGRGECKCNKCECFKDSGFRGKTCEDCKNCKEVCRKNRECVQCVVHETGVKSKEECDRDCREPGFITEVEELPGDLQSCEFKDEDDCIFYFSYSYNENNDLKIQAQKEKECPPQVNVLAIVLGVIGGIVAVGLAILLVWKLVTTISDKRELARFEKETQNAKWDTGENPIYKQATSTFKNPTYAGR